MEQNRAQVIAWVGMSEGGLVNHPDDPGGLTNKGITQRTYSAWLKSKGRKHQSVRAITKAEADQIVSEQYLDTVKFAQLPAGLDYSVADFSVNSGPARAIKELQKVLGFQGTAVDGILGAQTLARIEQANLESLIVGYNNARMAFLKRLKNWPSFKNGWTKRVMGQRDGFQSNDVGVIDRSVMLARGQANIPAPTHVDVPKTDDTQIKQSAILGKVLEDPVAFVPVIAAVGTLFEGTGPVQYALAALCGAGALYLAMRALRRGE